MNDIHNADEEKFWQLVEQIIELANNESLDLDPGIVSSALLQATARYNAFYIASSCETRNDLKEDKDESLRRFTSDYKRRLGENLEDYIENYKIYLGESADSQS